MLTFAALRVGVGFGVGVTIGRAMGENVVAVLDAIAELLDQHDLNVFTRLERATRA